MGESFVVAGRGEALAVGKDARGRSVVTTAAARLAPGLRLAAKAARHPERLRWATFRNTGVARRGDWPPGAAA